MFYIYILESEVDRSWYIGYSANLKQRLSDHRNKKGGRTTSSKRDWSLIYLEGYRNRLDAKGRERFLKSGAGRRYIKKQLARYFQN